MPLIVFMTKLDLGIQTFAFGVWMAVSSPRPYRKLDPASVQPQFRPAQQKNALSAVAELTCGKPSVCPPSSPSDSMPQ